MTVHDYTKVTISTTLLSRLFSHITVKDTGYKTPCWMWFPEKPHQYAFMYVNKVQYLVHRLMYSLFVAPANPAMHTDHLCRIPCCVNPSHLEMVTPRINTLRGTSPSAKNAQKTHCIRGHEFTPDNVWKVGKDKRFRVCRTCSTDYIRRHKGFKRSTPMPIRSDEHCFKGHPRTAETTRIRSNGYRECKICQRQKRDERRRQRIALGLPRD